MMTVTPLPRKRGMLNDKLMAEVLNVLDLVVPAARVQQLIDDAAEEVRQVCHGKRVLVGWSGGKDSLALEPVLRRADIEWVGVQGIAHSSLEVGSFLDWCALYRPPQVHVYEQRAYDLHWLNGPGLGYLFPANSRIGYFWTKTFTHGAQQQAYADYASDILIVGRRHADGNYIGENGIHTNRQGITQYSPIRDWSHEETLAVAKQTGKPWPPTYSWPRGWQVGTGPWSGWQGMGSMQGGFDRLFTIAPAQLNAIARVLEPAQRYLETRTGGPDATST